MSVSQPQKPHSLQSYISVLFLSLAASFSSMDSSQSTLEACIETADQRQRGQWIRAAILGANDGLLSTTSLMLGVGAAKEDRWSMFLSGIAGALAGAFSMAVGEFVSVSTQRDIEKAPSNITQIPDQHHHIIKLSKQGETETALAMSNALTPSTNMEEKMSPAVMIPESKLAQVFSPGRSPMMKVIAEDGKAPAKKITTKAATLPKPLKAAVASAMAFLCGASVPLVSALLFARYIIRIVVMALVTTIALALFGGFGAHLGGSPVRISAARVVAGGWMAMGITYALLKPFDKQ